MIIIMLLGVGCCIPNPDKMMMSKRRRRGGGEGGLQRPRGHYLGCQTAAKALLSHTSLGPFLGPFRRPFLGASQTPSPTTFSLLPFAPGIPNTSTINQTVPNNCPQQLDLITRFLTFPYTWLTSSNPDSRSAWWISSGASLSHFTVNPVQFIQLNSSYCIESGRVQ